MADRAAHYPTTVEEEPNDARQAADSFHSLQDDGDRSEAMYDIAAELADAGHPGAAYTAESLAIEYRAASGTESSEMAQQDRNQCAAAVVDFYRWVDDGTLPDDIGEALDRTLLLGHYADEFRGRLLRQMEFQELYNEPMVADTPITVGRGASLYTLSMSHEPTQDDVLNIRYLAREIMQDVTAKTDERSAQLEEALQHLRQVAAGVDFAGRSREEAAQWAQDLRTIGDHVSEYRNPETQAIVDWLEGFRNVDQLMVHIQPERAVVIGRTDDAVQRQVDDVHWLADPRITKVTGYAADHEIEGHHVFGYLPLHLEAIAESVTRYEPARDGQGREMVTYQVQEIEIAMQDIAAQEPTFTTQHPEQITHWRETGLLGAEQHAYLALRTTAEAAQMDGARLDAHTTVISLEEADWTRWVTGEDPVIVYGHIPDAAVPELVTERHVVGDLPHHLANDAKAVTSFSYHDGAYGQGSTYRSETIVRTKL